LEINLYWTGISIPEEIIVYNKHKQSIETVLLDKKVNFKTYEAKTQNLYIPFSKQTHTIKIKNCLVRYANLELSILECFYNIHPSNAGYLEGVITKALKKYQKTLKLTSFKHILKQGKHNSSANRLYKFTKNNQPDFAEELKKLVKKYGYIL
jgi:hypothetical protein